jgi:hypothetical protein
MSLAAVLANYKSSLSADCRVRTTATPARNHLLLSEDDRADHIPRPAEDVILRLSTFEAPAEDGDAVASPAAIAHSKLRNEQGYSAAMVTRESRILQVTTFGTFQENVDVLDFSELLPDALIVAHEVDAQLTQTVTSYTDVLSSKVSKAQVKVMKPQLLQTPSQFSE